MHPDYNTAFGLGQTVDGICRLSLLCVYISWTEELDMDKFLLLATKISMDLYIEMGVAVYLTV